MLKSNIRIQLSLFAAIFFIGSVGLFAQNKLDENGKKEGAWEGAYKDGGLRYVGQFKADVPVDTFNYYYPTGKLKMTLVWLLQNESYATMFYSTGEKMAEGKYLDQKKTGIWITYGANEIKVNEGNYLAGKKYELWKTFYPNGKVSEEVSFIADLENGEFKSYFENGKIQQEAIYKEGYRKGKTTIYYINGKDKIKGQYVKDVRDGIWIFYNEDGTVFREIEFDLGERITPMFKDETPADIEFFRNKVKDELDFEDMDGNIRYDEQRK